MGRWTHFARLIGRRAALRVLSLPLAFGTWAAVAHSDDPATTETAAAAKGQQRAAARGWFEDAKLGMFIHWGVYSLVGKGDWVMNNDKLPIEQYAKLPRRFNPTKFDAEAWVQLATSAGAQLHHGDGQAPRRLLHVRLESDRLRRR